MVDGNTIDRLRIDLNAVTEEVKLLKEAVAELREKVKIVEALDSEILTLFIRSQKENQR